MRIHLKNSPANFLSDPIWNDGAFKLFEDVRPKKKKIEEVEEEEQQQQQQKQQR